GVRELVGKMCRENPSWRAPRIHGELLKLGIDIGESSVSKYIVGPRKPRSQTWRIPGEAHQATGFDRLLHGACDPLRSTLRVSGVAPDRRRILHFHGTAHATAEWTAQQLREAFPFAQLPRFLLRDRDAIFGNDFREHVGDMGICEVLCASRAPWQRAYVERVIGCVRRVP